MRQVGYSLYHSKPSDCDTYLQLPPGAAETSSGRPVAPSHLQARRGYHPDYQPLQYQRRNCRASHFPWHVGQHRPRRIVRHAYPFQEGRRRRTQGQASQVPPARRRTQGLASPALRGGRRHANEMERVVRRAARLVGHLCNATYTGKEGREHVYNFLAQMCNVQNVGRPIELLMFRKHVGVSNTSTHLHLSPQHAERCRCCSLQSRRPKRQIEAKSHCESNMLPSNASEREVS
jgi:hypothetical protein